MDFELIENLSDATVYKSSALPATIGNAIYTFGSNDIREIVAFIDTSKDENGSEGIIITPTHFYYTNGVICFEDIQSIKTNKTKDYILLNDTKITDFHIKGLLDFFSDECELTVLLEGTQAEKIEYYLSMIANDLLDDCYEDVELDKQMITSLHNLLEELNDLSSLTIEDINLESEMIFTKYYPMLENLGLDSEEMDELAQIQEVIATKQQKTNEAFDQASRYYEDMINNLKNGDSRMYDRLKSAMKMVGIDEDDLKNKSPEELNDMLESLCKRFGVSKEQVEAFARRFNH